MRFAPCTWVHGPVLVSIRCASYPIIPSCKVAEKVGKQVLPMTKNQCLYQGYCSPNLVIRAKLCAHKNL